MTDGVRALLFRACGVLLGLGLGVAALEGGARVLGAERAAWSDDPLRVREPLPARAEVVAVGDSQTWGINASAEEAWPAVLARLLGMRVHNMGVSGAGPVQYRQAASRGLSLRPRTLVVGVYLGNDLWDAYHVAYGTPAYESLRRPGAPAELLRDTLGPRSQARMAELAAFREAQRGPLASAAAWVVRHSAAARLLQGAGAWPGSSAGAVAAADRRWVRERVERGVLYRRDGASDVLVPAYRTGVVDLGEPRIAEGMRITLRMLEEIRGDASRRGSGMAIVLIPTREAVYARALREAREAVPPPLARLATLEGAATARLREACRGAVCIDPLPALAAGVLRGERLYPPYVDGHFTPRGYAVLASAAAEALRRVHP